MAHPLVVNKWKREYDVLIMRPGLWGNPFALHDEKDRKVIVLQYAIHILSQSDLLTKIRQELAGKILGCCCAPKLCHGDVLARIANGEDYESFIDELANEI